VADELLEFFKALADPNRLKIVGLLARQSYTGEQLAAMLGIAESTVSHHLTRLVEAGLVSARAEGYYSIYALQTDAIRAKAQRLLSRSELPKLAQDVNLDAFDQKVLANFTDAEGRISRFPGQQNKFVVLLRHVLQAFEPGVRYTEREVNQILLRFNADTARLRRGLIEYRMMDREGGGGAYWRIVAEAGAEAGGSAPASA
jgi:predicted transcriptional regulator